MKPIKEKLHKISLQRRKKNQLLKKKLNIPTTQLIQASELTELEKENELLATELNDNKAKLLKLADEKKEWEK